MTTCPTRQAPLRRCRQPVRFSWDILIAGGGLSGMYSAYRLSQRFPKLKILLVEKNDRFGGRIRQEFLGEQPLDMGALRIPTDFVLTPALVNELGLGLIPFTTDLRASYTREAWFSYPDLNDSQQRYFLPPGTPATQTPQTLLLETLFDLMGTLDYDKLDPDRVVDGVRVIDWGIYDLLKTRLTSEQIEWISNSLNFSFYKNEMNAYEFCIHNYHSSQYYMVGPTFGNTIRIIQSLDTATPNVQKKLCSTVLSALFDQTTR